MSITLRLALTYLVLTLAGMLMLGVALTMLADRYLTDQGARELAGQAEIAAALLGELAATPAELQAVAPGALADSLLPAGTAVRVFSSSGALLMGDPALGPFPSRPALALVRPPLPLPASQAADRQYVAQIIPALGVIEISRSTAADADLLGNLRRLTLQAAAAAALAISLISLLVARTIARPIVKLTRRAEGIAARVGDGLRDRGAAGAEGRRQAPGPAPAAAIRPPRTASRDEIAQLAASLDQLEAQLQARMARIGDLEAARRRFYRSVSHELRTPLTALRGAIENLADRAPDEDQAALSSMEAEVLRLSRLVDDLLRPPDDGQIGPVERQPVDLSALVADLCLLLAGRAARAGIAISPELPPGLTALGDRDRLKQALLNLLDNALRVTPAGGRVWIDGGLADGRARVGVADSGPGVPAEQRDLIWERGRRGSSDTAGSAGLGLAIVREIVAAHGGRAYLDTQQAPGARFVIELPSI